MAARKKQQYIAIKDQIMPYKTIQRPYKTTQDMLNRIRTHMHGLKYGPGQSSFQPCSIELEFSSVIVKIIGPNNF